MKLFTLLAFLVVTLFTATAQTGCPVNLNFGTGDFSNWQCFTGNTTATSCVTNVDNVSYSGPVTNRHTILLPTAAVDTFGGFPITPSGVTNVARLGTVGQINAQVE